MSFITIVTQVYMDLSASSNWRNLPQNSSQTSDLCVYFAVFRPLASWRAKLMAASAEAASAYPEVSYAESGTEGAPQVGNYSRIMSQVSATEACAETWVFEVRLRLWSDTLARGLAALLYLCQSELNREFKDMAALREEDIGSKVWIRARVQNVRAKVGGTSKKHMPSFISEPTLRFLDNYGL